MNAWDEAPSPPPYTTKSFEEVLAEFAEATGRPLWTVTRTRPSYLGRKAAYAKAAAEEERWREAS